MSRLDVIDQAWIELDWLGLDRIRLYRIEWGWLGLDRVGWGMMKEDEG